MLLFYSRKNIKRLRNFIQNVIYTYAHLINTNGLVYEM